MTRLTFTNVVPARTLLTSGNNLYYTVGNIGIGTSTPSTGLDVNSTARITGNTTICGTLYVREISGVTFEGLSTQWSNSATPNKIYYNGNVGLGTSTPLYPLDVSGVARIKGTLSVDNLAVNDVAVFDLSGINDYIAFGDNSMYINTALNRVSIGKSNPTVALDVNGVVKSTMYGFHASRITSEVVCTSGNIINGYNNVLHNLTTTSSYGYNSSTGYFTAPVSGYYFFNASICVSGINNGFTIRKNAVTSGSGTAYGGHWNGATTTNTDMNMFASASAFIQLNIGETVSLWSSGGKLSTTNGGNYFTGYLINCS